MMLSFKKERSAFREIPVNLIDANPHQPRTSFYEKDLKTLSNSISRYGILNPLTVRASGSRFELISGERRLRASIMSGLTFVPCHIMGADSKQSAELALVENIVRSDLDFFEEAAGLLRLSSDFGLTQTEIAEKIGKTQSAVANKIRLLRLCPPTVEAVKDYGLTERHARALLRITDEITQTAVAQYLGEKALNVADSESHIDNVLRNVSAERKKSNRKVMIKDLRLFINAIRHHVESLADSGIKADFDKAEDDEFLTITVKIPK